LTWEGWATLVVVVLVVAALARDVAPAEVVLLGGLTALTTLGFFSARLLSSRDVAQGFGNEALVAIAVLLVVGAGLTETGGMALVAERLLGRPKRTVGAQARLMLPVAALSGFLNNTTVVALFMPVVREWSARRKLSPAKLFLPLSYAAVLGGVCTLIGTSTNLTVQGLLVQADLPTMGMFTISVVGIPIAVVGVAYVLVSSRWLLPARASAESDPEDPRQYTVEMVVEPGNGLVGRTVRQAGLRNLQGLYLAHIERDG
jgi:di/tricarboxylate transporter